MSSGEVLKRGIDVLLSGVGLVLSAPLWVLVSIAIKLDDGGPVFYEQERWGRGATRIRVRKFRTMVRDADRIFGNVPASVNDRRITRVGRLLRASGMDELPQLLSIFSGDMSLVGPRALAVDEKLRDASGRQLRYQDLPGFYERLSVRPGLTSLATVYRAKDIDPMQKFRTDLLYIRTRTLWLDLKLIAVSLWVSVLGRWEVRDSKVGPRSGRLAVGSAEVAPRRRRRPAKRRSPQLGLTAD